jgi:hypothetical protein
MPTQVMVTWRPAAGGAGPRRIPGPGREPEAGR